MPRFVILEHDHPVLHWDLMLEAGEALETWRLPAAPDAALGDVVATSLSPHRRLYLDYEGPVSGNRGTVRRWDAGTFADADGSMAESRILEMEGSRVRGKLWLAIVDEASWQCRWSWILPAN